MAMALGYHHDGEKLRLPPFETEMRRRLWWQILGLEIHLALACGFKRDSIPRDFDTKPPLNLNDADLYPDSTGELRSREGPTEMGFPVLYNRHIQYLLNEESREVAEFVVLGHGTPENPLDPETVERSNQRLRQLDEDLLDLERRFLSPSAGPSHLAAIATRPHIINRLKEMLRPMHEQPEWGTEIFGPRDNLFKVIVSASEDLTRAHHQMDAWGFCWFLRMHFHVEMLTSLTSQLYQRPVGPLSDRGWAVVQELYVHHPDLYSVSPHGYSKQARFTLKAFEVRERAFAAAGQPIETPGFIVRLRQVMKPFASATATADASPSAGDGTVQPGAQPPEPAAPPSAPAPGSSSLDSQQYPADMDPFSNFVPISWGLWGDVDNSQPFLGGPQF